MDETRLWRVSSTKKSAVVRFGDGDASGKQLIWLVWEDAPEDATRSSARADVILVGKKLETEQQDFQAWPCMTPEDCSRPRLSAFNYVKYISCIRIILTVCLLDID